MVTNRRKRVSHGSSKLKMLPVRTACAGTRVSNIIISASALRHLPVHAAAVLCLGVTGHKSQGLGGADSAAYYAALSCPVNHGLAVLAGFASEQKRIQRFRSTEARVWREQEPITECCPGLRVPRRTERRRARGSGG
eukprot:3886882-Rhodomonas_salina.1